MTEAEQARVRECAAESRALELVEALRALILEPTPDAWRNARRLVRLVDAGHIRVPAIGAFY